MKNLYPVICAIISIISSCSTPQNDTTIINLSGGKTVTVDSIATPCIFAPTGMFIIGDELILSNFRPDTDFDVFEIPSLKYTRSGGIVGAGPEDISGGSISLSTKKFDNNHLSMLNNSGHGVNIIDADGLISIYHKQLYIPEEWYYVQNHHFLSDGRQLLQQGRLPMEWGIVNKDFEIEVSFTPKLPDEVIALADDDMKKMFAHTAHSAVSEKEHLIAIIASCRPIIDFYDFSGKLKRHVIGSYTHRDNLDKTTIYTQNTDNLIYINYHDPADTDFTHSTIVAIDWEGNQVETYQVGIMVTTFAVDEKNKKIYFTTNGDNDNLYWFDL